MLNKNIKSIFIMCFILFLGFKGLTHEVLHAFESTEFPFTDDTGILFETEYVVDYSSDNIYAGSNYTVSIESIAEYYLNEFTGEDTYTLIERREVFDEYENFMYEMFIYSNVENDYFQLLISRDLSYDLISDYQFIDILDDFDRTFFFEGKYYYQVGNTIKSDNLDISFEEFKILLDYEINDNMKHQKISDRYETIWENKIILNAFLLSRYHIDNTPTDYGNIYNGQTVYGYGNIFSPIAYVNDRYLGSYSLGSSKTLNDVPTFQMADFGDAPHCVPTAITRISGYYENHYQNYPNTNEIRFYDTAFYGILNAYYSPVTGTNPLKMAEYAENVFRYEYGWDTTQAQLFPIYTYSAQIKDEIDNGRPVMMSFTNGYYGWHTITVVGYMEYEMYIGPLRSTVIILKVYDGWTSTIEYVDYTAVTNPIGPDYSFTDIVEIHPNQSPHQNMTTPEVTFNNITTDSVSVTYMNNNPYPLNLNVKVNNTNYDLYGELEANQSVTIDYYSLGFGSDNTFEAYFEQSTSNNKSAINSVNIDTIGKPSLTVIGATSTSITLRISGDYSGLVNIYAEVGDSTPDKMILFTTGDSYTTVVFDKLSSDTTYTFYVQFYDRTNSHEYSQVVSRAGRTLGSIIIW